MNHNEMELIETEITHKPICSVCENVVDVWDGDHMVDAYQKGGSNHYQWKCGECGVVQEFTIEIED